MENTSIATYYSGVLHTSGDFLRAVSAPVEVDAPTSSSIFLTVALLVIAYLCWPLASSSYIQERYKGWLYLRYGADIIQKEYFKSGGSPFKIFGPDVDHIFVSSKMHIKELLAARWDELSFFAATKHMFQPKWTMHGHNWLDERGAEGIGYVRAVGILLPQQIARIGPQMRDLVREQYEELFASAKVNADGSKEIQAYVLMKQIVCCINAHCFYGEELARDKEFMKAIYEYNEVVLTGAEILRVMPTPLKWILGPFIHARHGIQAKVFGAICGTVEKRLASKREATENPSTAPTERHEDMIQWIIDTAPLDKGWGSRRIAYEVLALWFGASHALASTAAFALYDLCAHREHIPALRAEVDDEVQFQKFLETSKGLPLLDSFIKESTRLSPMEAMSGRRMALQDFTFSDGTVVKKGDWTCIPLKAMQADPAFFPSPDEFHPFRFLAPELRPESASEIVQPEGPSRLTDASANFYYWGAGKIVCPGRFYVGVASKLLISYILHDLDVELVDKDAKTAAIWRSYILPMDETYVRFRRRQD